MEKTIIIDGKEVKFKATANTPRLYRLKFRRDMIQDMAELADGIEAGKISASDIEIYKNAAYIMAIQASDSTMDISEWVNLFKNSSIFDAFPYVLQLWNMNLETTSSDFSSDKNQKAINRPLTTPLFYLRCLQIGLSISDLDLLSIGMVVDMLIEQGNDSYEYEFEAGQADFDNF